MKEFRKMNIYGLQGRHHGFESEGDKICERSEQKKFFDPPTFGACGGYKKISWPFTLQSKIGILERTYKKIYVFNQWLGVHMITETDENILLISSLC